MATGLEGVRFVLGTAPSHVSIPLNQNGTMVIGRYIRLENVLGKIKPSERYNEAAFVFTRASWLCV